MKRTTGEWQVPLLFGVIHWWEAMTAKKLRQPLDQACGELIATAEQAPPGANDRNLAKWFPLHGDAYLRFITRPGIEPWNNSAEQAMRFVVIDRHINRATRSERGQGLCERFWTVIAICAQQNRLAFESLREAILAYLPNQPIPSLVPTGPRTGT